MPGLSHVGPGFLGGMVDGFSQMKKLQQEQQSLNQKSYALMGGAGGFLGMQALGEQQGADAMSGLRQTFGSTVMGDAGTNMGAGQGGLDISALMQIVKLL